MGLVVNSISKTYIGRSDEVQSNVEAVRDFSVHLRDEEILVMFGPNGCGKTTILNIIAGLTPADSGEITTDGGPVDGLKIGYIFQQYQDSLFPWRKNIDNVGFPLELSGVPLKTRRERAREFMERLDIRIPESAYPYQLSGGQQRLLTIARALIDNPDVLLMDEPFDGLDYFTRLAMQAKLLDLWKRTGVSVLFVSHDIDEAILMANRLVILTQRPARVFKTIEVSLPYPRGIGVMESAEFHRLRSVCLEAIQEVLAA